MENSTESRYITHPTVLEKTPDVHTVVLIDPYELEIKVLTSFLKCSPLTFDVYIYTSETYDLEWLNEISKSANAMLINNDVSKVTVNYGAIRYGTGLELTNCIDYFRNYAAQNS